MDIRAADADATAIEELVLAGRPSPEALTWKVSLELPQEDAQGSSGDSPGERPGPGTPFDWKVTSVPPTGVSGAARATAAAGPARAPDAALPKVGGVSANVKIDESDFENGRVRK